MLHNTYRAYRAEPNRVELNLTPNSTRLFEPTLKLDSIEPSFEFNYRASSRALIQKSRLDSQLLGESSRVSIPLDSAGHV